MGTQIWIASNPTDPFLRSFTVEKQVGLVAPRPPIPGQPSRSWFTIVTKASRALFGSGAQASLQRIKKEKFAGAVLIAVHHPPYVAVIPSAGTNAGNHGSSLEMLKDIDTICAKTGIWPHAVLSGHAHNYQRFTRRQDTERPGISLPEMVATRFGPLRAT